ncbi:MAG: hypothetical protein IJL85_07595 [Erysipelotrichaceae bacterium]|nr:hypothetical protein [Erysipelotrichaceae bacterium]
MKEKNKKEVKQMIRLLRFFTVVLFLISGCHKKEEPADDRIRTVETKEAKQGGFVSSFLVQDHEIYIYQPEDIMNGNIINYGYSAPLLMVFGEGKMEEEEAVDFICKRGIDRIAQENGGFVVFVNPLKNWDKEEYGIYETILAKTAVAQSGFSHGLLKDEKNQEYFIFASPASTCLYGYGKGADYIAKHYLKETTGYSSMSALGSDDITITAAILEQLNQKPVIQDRNIIIVSKNNDRFDKEAQTQSDYYYVSNSDFDEIYEDQIDGYQRWNGHLSETFNPAKLGLVMEPLVLQAQTSPDNKAIVDDSYELGAVVYYKKDTDKSERPLLMCFHGGGDTAITTATIAGWPQIAAEEDFILCAIEMHTRTTATETIEVIEQLKELYSIDESRIYATGFSMGGIKTWDLYQEYPDVFAALAPMGATVDVGQNTQFSESPFLNETVPVPLMYCGGEQSPLGELPFQNYVCINRINYLFEVNRIETSFRMTLGNRSEWADSVFGYAGDIVEEYVDETYPNSLTRIRYYYSTDGNIYTALCSISHHQHEIRPFTCRKAWEFIKKYSRIDGCIVISD